MKPIWYFVGLILSVIGGIIMATGIYIYATGMSQTGTLGHMHPNIWWGAIMLVVGIIYVLANRKKIVE